MADILSTFPPDTFYNLSDLFNVSAVDNATNYVSSLNGTAVQSQHGPSVLLSWLVKLVYVVGIVGNGIAIVCLRCGQRRVRNRKYLLLLTTLAGNDLVALLGMLTAKVVAEALPGAEFTRVYCGARVLLRVFGIGSVCIAVTMALERYLALTSVFLYQKHVTYRVICCWLASGWLAAAVLTCLPVAGFGTYWDPLARRCLRYKQATTTPEVIYAILFIVFGSLLCAALVYFNLAVIRALYAISAPGAGPPAVRRYSHASAKRHNTFGYTANAATAEEVAFSRLMAMLSVLFMICWLPQMVSSVMYLVLGPPAWPRLLKFSMLSDMLMLMNYVLNPILYVLMRQRKNVCQTIVDCFKRRHQTSTGSLKTSYCPETQLASDSGAPPDLDAAPAHTPLVSLAPHHDKPHDGHQSHSF